MNGWFNTRCDLTAWDGEDSKKGFEVLSKGEGQAMAWWTRNLARVKKKVLAFSWGTKSYDGHIDVEDQIYIGQVD